MARLRTTPFRGLDGRYHYTYLTTNHVNGKQYVGDRTCDKLPDFYIGSGTYFNRAKKKYGEENFTKVILAFFPTREQAHAFEEPMIKKYGTLAPNGYNESPTGGLGNGGGRHSEEARKKIQKRSTEYWKVEENRAKQSERMKEQVSKPVVQYALDGTFLQTYISIREAGRQTGIHETCIRTCCKGAQYSTGGFFWRFYEGNTDDIIPGPYFPWISGEEWKRRKTA